MVEPEVNENKDPGSANAGALTSGERVMAVSGYLMVMASVASFAVLMFIKFRDTARMTPQPYTSWLQLVQSESATISLFIIGIVTAILGKQLLTSARLANARTIPREDLPLIRQAVIDGKAEPIDQYVRLRSLSGVSGNFTKLGITGLPLTTVVLTLIFSGISILPVTGSKDFLDLAKLTLGAFIGSFVQRQVEQRRQETVARNMPSPTDGSSAPSSVASFPELPV
jgi:hypothetical protein